MICSWLMDQGATLEALQKENQNLQWENAELKEQNENLHQQNEDLQTKLENLENVLLRLKREVYGPKSERVLDNGDQQSSLFNEAEVESSKAPELEQETITYTRPKGKKKSKPLPEDLPREHRVIDLCEEEKNCPHDGTELECIGEDVKERVKAKPAQVWIESQRRRKYGCSRCRSHVARAQVSEILPKTIATPELVAYLIFAKFIQAMTLYRIEELFKLYGIELKRSVMASWLIKVSERLIPIWNILEEKLNESGYAVIDATRVQVLKEEGRSAQSQSAMWARGSPEQGIVLLDYSPSESGEVAKKLLENFEGGALQMDAHGGYDKINFTESICLGCMMHSRRRFEDAWKKSGKKDGVAAQALKRFKELYEYEKKYKKENLTPEQRKARRDIEIRPKLEQMKEWLEGEQGRVLPSSPLGNAINYFLREYPKLTAFLQNGRYEMDNGWIERVIRRFTVGRKNWMFSDTTEGAKASSVLYSLALTAKLNGKDPYRVFVEVFQKLPHISDPCEDYEKLAELFLSEPSPSSCLKKEGALVQ